MPAGDWSDFKERVRARTDLVQLIGERVALQSRRGGREFVGLCPFHEDHNPSLRVDPDRQSYKCWACGEGGDCFAYVQKSESVGFREALELLATRAGLEMPRHAGAASDGRPTRKELFDVLTWAETEYHTFLRTSAEAQAAREYLESRGFSREILGRFKLGFSPNDGQFLQRRARGRFNSLQLATARLISERRDGDGFYDYFRGRVMFPIHDASGRPVAFGGRVLPGVGPADAAKYVNSGDSPLFSKNRVVFALDVARPAIVERESAVVMEGYADCIMAHQFGIANAVATLGTALTDNHVSALKRFTRKVVLVFDGDKAGKDAAEKSLPRFLVQDVDLRILTLTSEKDPADFLVAQGADAFQKLIESAPEAWEYKLRLCVERLGLASVDARERVVAEMLELFRQAPRFGGSARENIVLNRLAFRVGLPETRIREMLAAARRKTTLDKTALAKTSQGKTRPAAAPSAGAAPSAAAPSGPAVKLETEMLELLFTDPTMIGTLCADVAVEDFQHEDNRRLLGLCFRLWEDGVLPSYENVMAAIEDAELKQLVVTLDTAARAKAQKLRLDCVIPLGAVPQGTAPQGALSQGALSQGAVSQGPLPRGAVGQNAGHVALLSGLIRQLKRRAAAQEVSMGRIAVQACSAGTLDPAQRDLLRRDAEIHGEREKARTTT